MTGQDAREGTAYVITSCSCLDFCGMPFFFRNCFEYCLSSEILPTRLHVDVRHTDDPLVFVYMFYPGDYYPLFSNICCTGIISHCSTTYAVQGLLFIAQQHMLDRDYYPLFSNICCTGITIHCSAIYNLQGLLSLDQEHVLYRGLSFSVYYMLTFIM